MTNQEAKQRLERVWKDYTSAYDTASIEDFMAFDMATNALGAIEQIQWERDMAIKQLHDLGYGLGEKPREELNNSSQEVKKANVPDTNVGDMVSRRFVELLAEYHDPEICPYKEYKGRPYFSIKYIENGEEFVGYGTYSPKVMSQYLREYFIEPEQTRTQMSLANCISRQAAIDELSTPHGILYPIRTIENMSSAQPDRKTGKWVKTSKTTDWRYECSECGSRPPKAEWVSGRYLSRYCPNCGAKMEGDSE